jgi:hypothetical protein
MFFAAVFYIINKKNYVNLLKTENYFYFSAALLPPP